MFSSGICCDLDGVLWDSESAHRNAFLGSAEMHFGEVARSFFNGNWGFGSSTHTVFASMLNWLNVDAEELLMNSLIMEKRFLANQYINEKIDINFELLTTLETFKDLYNSGIALVSASSRGNVENFLRLSGKEELFDICLSRESTYLTKPNPEPYNRALQLLRVQGSKSLAIDDSIDGIESATKANIALVLQYPFAEEKYTSIHSFLKMLATSNT